MKQTIKLMMLMAVLTLGWGCSSDNDDSSTSGNATFTAATTAPDWSVNMKSNDAAPEWVAPDPSKFESSMFTQVKLQDELVPYTTENDRMTVFTSGFRDGPLIERKYGEAIFSLGARAREYFVGNLLKPHLERFMRRCGY